jgi:hypothetical protein
MHSVVWDPRFACPSLRFIMLPESMSRAYSWLFLVAVPSRLFTPTFGPTSVQFKRVFARPFRL